MDREALQLYTSCLERMDCIDRSFQKIQKELNRCQSEETQCSLLLDRAFLHLFLQQEQQCLQTLNQVTCWTRDYETKWPEIGFMKSICFYKLENMKKSSTNQALDCYQFAENRFQQQYYSTKTLRSFSSRLLLSRFMAMQYFNSVRQKSLQNHQVIMF